VNELRARLLAAFQVEHKEYLQGIRNLLDKLDHGRDDVSAAELEECFRQAHSLRAAARVCDFSTIEALGQRLETFLTRLRRGTLQIGPEVIGALRAALAAIETWATALAEGSAPEEPVAALAPLDRLLANPPPPAPAGQVEPAAGDELAPRLLAAFQVEHREHLEGIRAFLAQVEIGGASSVAVDEAFRRAHSLKGAARLAGLGGAETLAHRLESLFAQARAGALPLSPPVLHAIAGGLDAIEDVSACVLTRRPAPDTAPALAAIAEVLSDASTETATSAEPSATVAAPVQPVETVRVDADNLDRLLRCAGQLLSENLRQSLVERELAGLRRRLDDLERDWEAVRDSSAAALRELAATPGLARVGRYVGRVEHEIRALARQARGVGLMHRRSSWTLGLLGNQLQEEVRRVRMVPAASLFEGFRKMMRDLAHSEDKQLDFRALGLEIEVDRLVLQVLKDPIMHVLCNAVSHGIEPPEERRRLGKPEIGAVTLRLDTLGNRLRLDIEDDGRGIDPRAVAEAAVNGGFLSTTEAAALSPPELLRQLFRPGFSTAPAVTGLAGRGMGLSVVQEAVARLQGEVSLEPGPSAGTRLTLSVPLSIATQRLLLVACQGQTLALPMHAVEQLLRVKLAQVESVEGRPMVLVEGQPVPVASLAHLLKMPRDEVQLAAAHVLLVLLRVGSRRLAVAVDALLAERDSLVNELDAPAAQVRVLAGGILLEDGTVALVLNPAELLNVPKQADRTLQTADAAPRTSAPTVLVVDDSLTTRTLEKSLLEAHGYQVRLAMDGIEALAQLRDELPDLVITDIQMPRMDGFRLLEEIRKDERLASLPVIVVTSMEKREDQERGLALGADAYIVKKKFDHQELLETIRQIV
jgi:two-component system chemotaxis sensor kinase CheA